MKFNQNDGGRAAAGYKGFTGDCATRALAIAAEMPYQEAYDLVNKFSKDEKPSKRRNGKSSARTGVHTHTFRKIMDHLEWRWTPLMFIGQGCAVHMDADELPGGRLICRVSKHFTAVIDGVINDSHDCSREGKRCVYGYWAKDN